MFIELGWHTVPLKGKLDRLEDGKKTIPDFPKDFKERYTEELNDKDTALGGVMTGTCSGIVAIDCDSDHTYKIFTMLDPEYKAHMVSRGKLNSDGTEMSAGTIIYKYTPELEENFIHKLGEMKMDFYSNKGFIYLPTRANKTKNEWTEVPEIKEMPSAVISLLKSLKPVKQLKAEIELSTKKWASHLGPQVKQFLEKKKVTKALFRILTPKDFRTTNAYIAQGFCHPVDIEDGRGSEYLSKVSAILGADESIDEDTYSQAMTMINGLFSDPMKKSRLEQTIIEPMIEERAQVDGEVIWRYNKNWETQLTIIVTKLNSSLHVFYDMTRKLFYAIDISNEVIHSFKRDADFYGFIETVATESSGKAEIRSALPLVSVVSTPKFQFGFFGDTQDSFNVFTPTIPLTIFKNPKSWEKNYRYPEFTIKYLQSLVPDDDMRSFLCGFLRRKFDLFEYSPVVLYFLGASGSGKDLLVELLQLIIGDNAIAKPTAKVFLETHNGWMLDKYFAQLDEYGDQISHFNDKEMAKGLIKTWSGKANVNIRKMQTDGFQYEHNITFIMTANKNPLTFDADDRRIALFNTPNVLRFNPEVEAMGIAEFVERVKDEVNDFAYYLSTHIKNVSKSHYMTPPETEDKQRLIASKLSAGSQLAYLLKNQLFSEFEKLSTSHNVPEVMSSSHDNKLYEDDLFDLYMEMTEGAGTKRGLTSAMQEFDKIPTSRKGTKAYYYVIPNLKLTKILAVTPIKGDFNGE
jgi:hypothetical protein